MSAWVRALVYKPLFSVLVAGLVVGAACDEGGDATDVCGNGVLEAGEACDGADFGGDTCATLYPLNDPLGYGGALPGCTAGCEVDPSPCQQYCMACLYSALEVSVVAGDGTGMPPAGLWLESSVSGGYYECGCLGEYGTDCTAADACDGIYEFGGGLGAGVIEVTAHAPGYRDATALVAFDADLCGTPPKELVELEMWPDSQPPNPPPVFSSLTPGCM